MYSIKTLQLILIAYGVTSLSLYLIAFIVFNAIYSDSFVGGLINILIAVVSILAIAPYRNSDTFCVMERRFGFPIYSMLFCCFFIILIVLTFGTLSGVVYFAVMVPLFAMVVVYAASLIGFSIYLDHRHVGEPVSESTTVSDPITMIVDDAFAE